MVFPQCLEEEFQGQLEEQEQHYGHYLVSALASERTRVSTPSRWTPWQPLTFPNIALTTHSRSGDSHNDSSRSSSRYRPDITLGTSSIGRSGSWRMNMTCRMRVSVSVAQRFKNPNFPNRAISTLSIFKYAALFFGKSYNIN